MVSSLGTKWGLSRHFWVVISLVLTVVATHILLTLVHSVGGIVVLLMILALTVFKPRGLTCYGHRKQHWELRRAAPSRRQRAIDDGTVMNLLGPQSTEEGHLDE